MDRAKSDRRSAEKKAMTAADHARLAAYYQAKAKGLQAKMMEEEELVATYGQDLRYYERTKIPNPYHSAKSLAGYYRMEWQKASSQAAEHQSIAKSMSARPTVAAR